MSCRILHLHVIVLLICVVLSSKVKFDGFKVYRVFARSKNDILIFAHLAAENDEDLDIWHYSNEPKFFDILVGPKASGIFHSELNRRKCQAIVLIADLEKIIETSSSRKKILRRSIDSNEQRITKIPNDFSLRKYNSLHTIYDWLKYLNNTHNDVVNLLEIGRSFESRPIYVLKIGKAVDYAKPAVWLDAGIHSREWLSIGTALYLISELVNKYKRSDIEIKPLIDQLDFYIAPLSNPDGYQYSRKTNRLWRKTRSLIGNVTNAKGKVCVGVDANRNFDHFWGSVREAGDEHPCSDGYSGRKPFSEPESMAIANQLKKLQPKLLAYITLHSYGQMWLAPWGYDSMKPLNYQRQRDVALRAIDALQSVHGTPYSFGTVNDLLYPASGTSVDYAHSLNVSYSYAIELRPGDTGGYDNGFRGFLYPDTQIIPTGEEILEAIKALAEEILNENEISQR